MSLLPGLFKDRSKLNREYVMSLKSVNLLQNHLIEACLLQLRLNETQRNRSLDPVQVEAYRGDLHWGWESPGCQVRGQFLGHWLSAAARTSAGSGDAELRAKADAIVQELARCQEANGGEWVASIPPSYLDRVARGQWVWAPHYVAHKTLMGLFDMYKYAKNELALEIVAKAANWFHRWSGQFPEKKMAEILDTETGGMLELWADLYGATGDKKHLELLQRYTRTNLYDALLRGEDVLTNRHANTTIPEAHGAARAYEVTGDRRWREIVEAYWKCAVTDRGTFCTGGQSSGEVWTPPFEFAARLGDTNQEHCTVYNMIRLADWLLRWTGEARYSDYIERNLYNGILAQQNRTTGMIAYFLPLEAGAHKIWGSPTHDFWCCHGTLVQAHATYSSYIYYRSADGIAISQYIPSEIQTMHAGTQVKIGQSFESGNLGTEDIQRPGDAAKSGWHRPSEWTIKIAVDAEKPVDFQLQFRVPDWIAGPTGVTVNGETRKIDGGPGFKTIDRKWHHDQVTIELPKSLTAVPIPDQTDTVAFMDGPIVLAGLSSHQRRLTGDKDKPETMLIAGNEREWWNWLSGYRTTGQPENISFIPLLDVVDEDYTVYFEVSSPTGR